MNLLTSIKEKDDQQCVKYWDNIYRKNSKGDIFFLWIRRRWQSFLFMCCLPYNNLGKSIRIAVEFPRGSSKQKSLWMARDKPTTPNLEKTNAWSIEHQTCQVCDLCRKDELDKNIFKSGIKTSSSTQKRKYGTYHTFWKYPSPNTLSRNALFPTHFLEITFSHHTFLEYPSHLTFPPNSSHFPLGIHIS